MPEFQVIASGSFVSDGAVKKIPLRSDFDFFETENHTQAAGVQTPGRVIKADWRLGYAADSAFVVTKEDAADTVENTVVTTGGFTREDTSEQSPGPEKTGTTITAATPAVGTSTAHGYSNGDTVRVYSSTGMLQIAGMEFTIGSVAANTFELAYLAAAGFAAGATAFNVRKIANPPIYVPNRNFITSISQASQAVVILSITHNLSVGDKIRMHVAAEYGMLQMEGLVGTVLSVNTTTNAATLDIDSTAFDAFAFPTSAIAAGGVTQAHVVPFGTVANDSESATDNISQIQMSLAGGAQSPAGSAADVIYWRAMKSGFVNNEQ